MPELASSPVGVILMAVALILSIAGLFVKRGTADVNLQESYRKFAEGDRQRLETLERKLETREKQYDDLKDAADSSHKQLAQTTAELGSANATIQALQRKQAEANVEREYEREQLKQIPELKRILAENNLKIIEGERQSEQNRHEITLLRQEMELMRKSHAEVIAEKDAELERLKREKAELEKRIDELEREKKTLVESQQAKTNGEIAAPPTTTTTPPPDTPPQTLEMKV